MSRCPTPDYSPRLSPEAMQLRDTAPSDYPCFTENGYYQFKSGCRSLCCIVPAHMAGDDSPAWQEREQLRTAEEPKDKPAPQVVGTEIVAKHEAKMKTESTGKTQRMMATLSSPARNFFPESQLKRMYPPDSGSSSYTEPSPPNLHHPDVKKSKKEPRGLPF